MGYTAQEALGKDYSLMFSAAEIDAGLPRREMEEAARKGDLHDPRLASLAGMGRGNGSTGC